jgi:Zn finger protein HypA/HybF involved in hydrogenase expression
LAEQWGDERPFPFVFEKNGLADDFQLDMETSYLTFTCCAQGHKHVLPPSEILKMIGKGGPKQIPCPICQASQNITVEEDDDMPLPGEDVVGIPMTEQEKLEMKQKFEQEQREKRGIENKEETASVEEPVSEEENIPTETESEEEEESEDDVDEEESISEDEKNEQLQNEVLEKFDHLITALGYDPFYGDRLSVQDGKVSTKCKLCGNEVEISLENFGKVVESSPNVYISTCPVCAESMVQAEKSDLGLRRNNAFKEHIQELLTAQGFKLYILKGQLFQSPFEKIVYEDTKTGLKYQGKISDILTELEFNSENEEEVICITPPQTNSDNDDDDEDDIPEASLGAESSDQDESDFDGYGEEDGETTSSTSDNESSDQGEESDNNDNGNPFSNFFGNFFGNGNKKEETQSSFELPKLNSGDDEVELDFGGSSSNVKAEEDLKETLIEGVKDKEKIEKVQSRVVTDDEVELEFESPCLGKSKPAGAKQNDKAERSDSKFRDLHQQDPLQRHVDEKNRELQSKWYNSRVIYEKEPDFNELGDDEDLIAEFEESAMGKLINLVSEKTQVSKRLILNESSFQLPIVDFSTGVRVMCLDVNDESQMKSPLEIANTINFQWPLGDEKKYRRCYLYSDSVSLNNKKHFKATLKSLSKIVGRDTFDPRRIINIADNYMLFYVDDVKVIKDFEEENSTYPMGKPHTNKVAIIAMKYDGINNKKITIKDIFEYYNKSGFDMKKYNLHMVASARYITAPKLAQNHIEYFITEYTEMTSSIIMDGFEHILGAILKEHNEKYPTVTYQINYEFDPSLMSSPSLEIYYDNGSFLQLGVGDETCYIRRPSYRRTVEDSYRQDMKYFTISTLSKRFSDEVRHSGYNITIESQRNRFIDSLGFIKVYQPKMKKFLISPVMCLSALCKPSIMTMTKVDLSIFFSGSGIYSGGYDQLLFQRMLFNAFE